MMCSDFVLDSVMMSCSPPEVTECRLKLTADVRCAASADDLELDELFAGGAAEIAVAADTRRVRAPARYRRVLYHLKLLNQIQVKLKI